MRVYPKLVPTVHQKGGSPSSVSQKDEQPITMTVVVSVRATSPCTYFWGKFFYSYDLSLAVRLLGSITPPAKTMNMSTKLKDL